MQRGKVYVWSYCDDNEKINCRYRDSARDNGEYVIFILFCFGGTSQTESRCRVPHTCSLYSVVLGNQAHQSKKTANEYIPTNALFEAIQGYKTFHQYLGGGTRINTTGSEWPLLKRDLL
jgi:hypothetical protein